MEESKQKNSKHRKRVPTSVFCPAKWLVGKCPKPSNSRKERQHMNGRKRTVQLKFRVTEAERDLILEKMKLIPTRNMAAYLRKIAIDGYIIQIDHSDIKAMTAEIQKIGVNVNQIARRVNSTGGVYQEDIDEIKGVLNEIWRLQRLSYSPRCQSIGFSKNELEYSLIVLELCIQDKAQADDERRNNNEIHCLFAPESCDKCRYQRYTDDKRTCADGSPILRYIFFLDLSSVVGMYCADISSHIHDSNNGDEYA